MKFCPVTQKQIRELLEDDRAPSLTLQEKDRKFQERMKQFAELKSKSVNADAWGALDQQASRCEVKRRTS